LRIPKFENSKNEKFQKSYKIPEEIVNNVSTKISKNMEFPIRN